MSLFDVFENLFKIDLPTATVVDFTAMTPYELGRNVLLPFVLVYIILWAILERMRVFGKRVNVILSLGISVLLATTPAYTIIAAYITQVSGSSMVIIFGILLVGGTLMWALGRGRGIYYEQVAIEKKIANLEKKIRKARRKGQRQTAEALEAEKRQWIHEMRERHRD